jgi:hypothetical protein
MPCSPATRARHLQALARGLALALAALALPACGSSDGTPPDNRPDAAEPPEIDAARDPDASLADLRLSRGTLEPVFAPHVTSYRLDVSLLVPELVVTPTPASDAATVTVNGVSPSEEPLALPLALGENDITIEVTAEAGNTQTYTIVVTRSADAFDQRYTKPNDPTAEDQFGSSVALSGDLLAVGVPFESGVNPQDPDGGNLSQSGAVYVFRRDSTVWVQDAYLKASNPDELDRFGASVAIHGDTLVVGAPGESSADPANPQSDDAIDSGAAYVFRRGDAGWQEEAYLKAANLGASDLFGASVAIDGDTVAVGATGESSSSASLPADNGARNSGAVYVFQRTGTAWQQQAYLKAAILDSGDAFGTSLALQADTLAVGAPLEDSANATDPASDAALSSGAVYVFQRTGTTWQQQAYLKATNLAASDAFGTSVALHGPFLAVGAPGEDSRDANNGSDNTASNSGAVYVFQSDDTGWAQKSYLKAGNIDEEDAFGASVALHGAILAVGAPGEDSGDPRNPDNDASSGSGAVYVFLADGAVWLQQAYLKAEVIDASDAFGASVAMSDGVLAAGATGESSGVKVSPHDNSAQRSGAVYLVE